jgi:hypothetical protein
MKDFLNTWFLSRSAAEIVFAFEYSPKTHYISGAFIGWRIRPKTEKMIKLYNRV